ncbi:MAG TPA: DoxX family protein [Polyangiaceae bacterium]|jgi:putative oxidoreductase
MNHLRLLAVRERSVNFVLTLLRVTVGVVMAAHGWSKLSDTAGTAASFAELGLPLPSLLVYVAVLTELFGGLALIFGLLTRYVALGIACTLVVAIVFAHLGNGLMAKNGGFEYPLTLLLVALLFVVNGGGTLSIDHALERRRQRHAAHVATVRTQRARAEARRAAHGSI